MEKCRLLLVDDHVLMREPWAGMLEATGKFEVLQASNGEEAVAYAETYNLDLILMDIEMPEMSGIKATSEILKKKPNQKVLVVTARYDEESVYQCIEAGALGMVNKDTTKEALLVAIDTVLNDGHYFGPKPLKALISQQPNPGKLPPGVNELSPREIEIVRLMAEGLASREIASKLFLSKRTIDSHRDNILRKLDLKNATHLVAFSLRHGIIQ